MILNHKRDNGNVHRAAAKIIVSKSRAARGSVCNVLLSGVLEDDCGSFSFVKVYAIREFGAIGKLRVVGSNGEAIM